MRRRPLSILVSCFLVAACSTTTAHRVPITGNPAAEAAVACVEACRTSAGRTTYVDCLDRCPGAIAVRGQRCNPHRGVEAACVETTEADGSRTFLGLALGVVVALVVISALGPLAYFARQ
jgi:hypothetical protein